MSVESYRKACGEPIGAVSRDETPYLCKQAIDELGVVVFCIKSCLTEKDDKLSSGVGIVRVSLICTLNVKIATAIVSKSINAYHEHLNSWLITNISVLFHSPP